MPARYDPCNDPFFTDDAVFAAHCKRLAANDTNWGTVLRTLTPHLLEPAGPLGADPDTDGGKAPKAPHRLPRGPRLRNV